MTEAMLKRLVGVVCVKDGWAVQSIGYARYLPIGRVETVVENLDRWNVDEVLVLSIDRSSGRLGPDFDLLDRIARRRPTTPLCFGGGIRGAEDAIGIVRGGADRVCMDSLFREDPAACRGVAAAIGRQAVVRAQPAALSPARTLDFYDYRDRSSRPARAEDIGATRDAFSELLLIDWQSDGRPNSFRDSLLDGLPEDLQVICFGGISEPAQIERLVMRPIVSAVAIGNFLNFQELANRRLEPAGARGILRGVS